MSYSIKERYVPEPTPIRAELIVRPEMLRVSMSVSVEMEQLSQALPLLQRTCEQYQRRLRDVLLTDVTFRPRNARFNRASGPTKLLQPDDDNTFISVEGVMELPLPVTLDFWARGARVGALVRTCHEAERDSRHAKKLPQFSFGAVEAVVARPEAHRAELLRHAVGRAREMAEAAGHAAAPLHVVSCTAPGAVEQTPGSIEEVGLSLHVTCHLGVVRAPAVGDAAEPGH